MKTKTGIEYRMMRRELDYLRRISKNNLWRLAEEDNRFQLQYVHSHEKVFVHSDWFPAAEMTTFLRMFYLNVPPSADEDHNDAKAGFAASALAHYVKVIGGGSEPMETTIADLLADLGHYCDRHGLDFPAIRQHAADSYAGDADGKGEQFDAELSYDPSEPNGLNPQDKCAKCGQSTDDGEGYDGLCGNCADKEEKASKA